MNDTEIKACRDEQASRVMPLIGGLLDAWDALPNDIKEDTEILQFSEHVEAIDNAMEQAAGDHQPEAKPNAGNIAGSISAIGSAKLEAITIARRGISDAFVEQTMGLSDDVNEVVERILSELYEAGRTSSPNDPDQR